MQMFYIYSWGWAIEELVKKLQELGYREMIIQSKVGRYDKLIQIELAPHEPVALSEHFDVMIQRKDVGIVISLDEKGLRFTKR